MVLHPVPIVDLCIENARAAPVEAVPAGALLQLLAVDVVAPVPVHAAASRPPRAKSVDPTAVVQPIALSELLVCGKPKTLAASAQRPSPRTAAAAPVAEAAPIAVAVPAAAPAASTSGRYRALVFAGNNCALIAAALQHPRRAGTWCDVSPPALGANGKPEPPAKRNIAATAHLLPAAAKVHFVWRPTLRSLDVEGRLRNLHDYVPHSETQVLNHMPKNGCLCTKHGLLATLETYYPALGLDTFDVMPLTFAVPGLGQHGVASDAFAAFARVFRLIERKGQTAGAGAGVRCPARWLGKNVWLLKPAALNCGKGIAVCRTMEEIVRKLESKDMDAEVGSWVLQKYIETPLLYKKRKFDMRLWAVVVANPFAVYVYKEGYLRTSSQEYSTDAQSDVEQDLTVHLTNYCFQRKSASESLGKHEDGNTIFFDDLQAEMDATRTDGASLVGDLMPEIHRIVVDAVLAARSSLIPPNSLAGKRSAFELFGYDFMIEDTGGGDRGGPPLRPWLLEVNSNPFLGVQNERHGRLVEGMVEDMLRVAVDPHFEKRPEAQTGFRLLYEDAKPKGDRRAHFQGETVRGCATSDATARIARERAATPPPPSKASTKRPKADKGSGSAAAAAAAEPEPAVTAAPEPAEGDAAAGS